MTTIKIQEEQKNPSPLSKPVHHLIACALEESLFLAIGCIS